MATPVLSFTDFMSGINEDFFFQSSDLKKWNNACLKYLISSDLLYHLIILLHAREDTFYGTHNDVL